MNFPILIVFALLISSSYANTIEFDYCVGDSTLSHGPSGYSCNDPAKVTVDDFYYSGLRLPSNTSNVFKFGASSTWGPQFPALTGMGISFVRADFEVGGAGPIHSHRVAELIIVAEGTIIAGFIDTNNRAFYKTLEKGDMFVVPPTLGHFQVNVGNVAAVVYAAFGGQNPGFQPITNALFKQDFPTDIIHKITLLDIEQIQKLKKVFGGTN